MTDESDMQSEMMLSYPDKITEEVQEEMSQETNELLEEKKVDEAKEVEAGMEPQKKSAVFKEQIKSRLSFRRGYKQTDLMLKNTILCHGRLVGGPQRHKYIQTLCVIIIPIAIFCAKPY
ncbi:hypothetical protein RFI_11574, partial [Reticulomyxa filosa]